MKIKLLKNHPQDIPTIAQWYFEEWGYLSPDKTQKHFKEKLQDYLNEDKIPLMVIARDEEEVVGAAQLKFREMSIYPEKEHWLGGVYVAKEHRGKNITEQIIAETIKIAKSLDVQILNLQTEHLDGGLYKRLGWKAIEQVNYRGIDVVVMERKL